MSTSGQELSDVLQLILVGSQFSDDCHGWVGSGLPFNFSREVIDCIQTDGSLAFFSISFPTPTAGEPDGPYIFSPRPKILGVVWKRSPSLIAEPVTLMPKQIPAQTIQVVFVCFI